MNHSDMHVVAQRKKSLYAPANHHAVHLGEDNDHSMILDIAPD